MGFEIRPALSADAPFLAGCWRAMLDELEMARAGLVPDWRERLERAFAAGMAEERHGWFVAQAPEGPVGCAGVFFTETGLVQLDRIATIAGVYVAPASRRGGIARELTRRAIAWAKERGCVTVRLTAAERAEPLYRSLGFQDGRELVLKLA